MSRPPKCDLYLHLPVTAVASSVHTYPWPVHTQPSNGAPFRRSTPLYPDTMRVPVVRCYGAVPALQDGKGEVVWMLPCPALPFALFPSRILSMSLVPMILES